MKKKRNAFGAVFMLLAAALLMGYGLWLVVPKAIDYARSGAEYEELERLAVQERPVGEKRENEGNRGTDAPDPEEPAPLPEDAPLPPIIDWDALDWEGSEVVGWIYVPSVDISYPIADGDSNEKYLHRTVQGTELFAGSVFLEAMNSGLYDRNTILYSHNMRNGSMFAKLNKFRSQSVYDQSPYIWVLTKDREMLYRIVSVHYSDATVEDASYRIFTQTASDETFAEWLKSEHDRTVIESPIPDGHKDRMLTLSTCHGDASSRQVVQAVLILENRV